MGTDGKKEERKKCALTSTGLLMEGVDLSLAGLTPLERFDEGFHLN